MSLKSILSGKITSFLCILKLLYIKYVVFSIFLCKFAHKKKKYIIMEGQTKLSAGQIGILINARIKDMAMWLMEDFKYSLEEALDCVYNSELLRNFRI